MTPRPLSARIAQGRGTRAGRPRDQERAPVRPRHRRARRRPTSPICGDTIVGTYGDYRGAREIDGRGPHRRAGLHRHASARRILARDAARVRALRAAARRHDGDLRPARDRERRSAPQPSTISSPAPSARSWTCACSSRAACRRPHLETSGARIEAADLLRYRDHPKVIGLAEFMNFPGRARRRSGLPREARGFRGRPYRRPRAAAARAATSTAISPPASAPTTRRTERRRRRWRRSARA